MDIKEIQELIKFVAKSGATEVNLEIDNVKISIKSPAKKGALPETIIQQIPVAQAPTVIPPTPVTTTQKSATEIETPTKKDNNKDDKYITIKSPMIGTFYRKPSPEKDILGPMFFNAIPNCKLSFSPVTYCIPASSATPVAPKFEICSEIIFTVNPPYMLFENT